MHRSYFFCCGSANSNPYFITCPQFIEYLWNLQSNPRTLGGKICETEGGRLSIKVPEMIQKYK